MSSPFWEWQALRRTVYLVTDKRAISIRGGWFTKIRIYLPGQLKNVYRREKSDGTGDVIMGKVWVGSGESRKTEEIGFLKVRNPQEVENMLRQLVQNNA
jgi:hypothetical protein